MITTRRLQETRSVTQRNELLHNAEEELQRERDLRLCSEWKEDSRGVCAARIQRRQDGQVTRELITAGKELLLVRRAALRHQLEEEQRQYREELHRHGKSLHRERL